MGAGWRLALCTTIPRDRQVRLGQSDEDDRSHSPSPSPRSCVKLRLFKSASNPSTPRLQSSENLHFRTTTPEPSPVTVPSTSGDPHPRRNATTPRPLSSPSSPMLSPLKFSFFNNSLGLSRSRCGVCFEKVRTGKGTAIYRAECSHAFHFPCVTAHVRGPGGLSCPVCAALWRDPLLAIHNNFPDSETTTANGKPKSEMQKSHRPRGALSIKKIAYDDDEPLQPSPAAAGHFDAIPEAAGEGDDDDGEFQGLFVPRPNNPSPYKSDDEATYLRRIDVRLLPGTALISAGGSHETYAVALRVKAPSLLHSPPITRLRGSQQPARFHRAPIDLVTVLDVGGSMTGAKLQMLKRTMRLVISSLGPADRLSVIAFDCAPKRLLPLKRMTPCGQRLARRVVDGLASGQRGSRAAEALHKASKVLEQRRERNPVASVILLSDGQDGDHPMTADDAPSEGVSFDAPLSTRFAHVEIPVRALAFGEAADDEFSKCVGGLLSVVVRDLKLRLGFAAGSVPAEVAAVYSCHGRPSYLGSGNDAVSLGNLYAEEEREVLVELRVPVSSTDGSHSTSVDPVMSIRCSYRDPGSLEPYGSDHVRVVPRPSRSAAPRFERLRIVFITARAVAESRRLRGHGELSHAHLLLSSARRLLAQAGGSAATDFVRCLDDEIAELHWRRRRQHMVVPEETLRRRMAAVCEPVTPTSGWRAAERFARAASAKKPTASNRVSDLHGFENARF